MCVAMDQVGLEVERSHHEVGSPGQAEINYKFSTLTNAADDLLKFKYVIKNTADEWGKSVTFMPKPVFGDNGSGMHCHQSLWLGGERSSTMNADTQTSPISLAGTSAV